MSPVNRLEENGEVIRRSGPGSDIHEVVKNLAYLVSLGNSGDDYKNWTLAQEMLARYGSVRPEGEMVFPGDLTEYVDKIYYNFPGHDRGDIWLNIAKEVGEKLRSYSV